MQNLKRAHQELFKRSADECFESLDVLFEHCKKQKEHSQEYWKGAQALKPVVEHNELKIDEGSFPLNDWSFTQLCQLARVSKDTVNKLSPETATKVFDETLPHGNKPYQYLITEEQVRSIHGTAYTRLHNADLLTMVRDTADGFEGPQKADGGATGLYCGEQDMFAFLIDPLGWAEIEGEAFAPGFFVWNSEVGKRSVGVQTFWFQKACANHIVWDAVEVIEFKRKHTANVRDALEDIHKIIAKLVHQRDVRRDSFVKVLQKAMVTRLGSDTEEVLKQLAKTKIPNNLAKQALEMAKEQGSFTIFSVVDALTRLAGEIRNAGDRFELDQRVGTLLQLAA